MGQVGRFAVQVGIGLTTGSPGYQKTEEDVDPNHVLIPRAVQGWVPAGPGPSRHREQTGVPKAAGTHCRNDLGRKPFMQDRPGAPIVRSAQAENVGGARGEVRVRFNGSRLDSGNAPCGQGVSR